MSRNIILGIWIDEILKYNAHCEYVQKKLSIGLFAVRQLKILPKFLLKTIYYSVFDSHINYSLIAWGGTYKYLLNPIIILQKMAIRIVCNKTYNYPTQELFKELKILNFGNL